LSDVEETGMPSESSSRKIELYVRKYCEKTGMTTHPDAEITRAVVRGLAQNLDELGRPLCPCNFYPDKKAQVANSREWNCACDEMKHYKFCHCLLFVTPEGLPVTEHLPEGHYGRETYGVVKDPDRGKGREGRKD
jgi:ferredoxin-thioredoxin reductase catalytic chain